MRFIRGSSFARGEALSGDDAIGSTRAGLKLLPTGDGLQARVRRIAGQVSAAECSVAGLAVYVGTSPLPA
jgi:hypothetical protein